MSSFARSAELLKYTWPGWDAAGVEGPFITWVNRVMMPALTHESLQVFGGGVIREGDAAGVEAPFIAWVNRVMMPALTHESLQVMGAPSPPPCSSSTPNVLHRHMPQDNVWVNRAMMPALTRESLQVMQTRQPACMSILCLPTPGATLLHHGVHQALQKPRPATHLQENV
jgi:hypothetical protein